MILAHSPWVNPKGLQRGLYSPLELCVDPPTRHRFFAGLACENLGVEFRFGTAVLGFDANPVHTSAGSLQAGRLIVCSGEDFLSLYPAVYADTGHVRCKLQMLRSQPYGDE